MFHKKRKLLQGSFFFRKSLAAFRRQFICIIRRSNSNLAKHTSHQKQNEQKNFGTNRIVNTLIIIPPPKKVSKFIHNLPPKELGPRFQHSSRDEAGQRGGHEPPRHLHHRLGASALRGGDGGDERAGQQLPAGGPLAGVGDRGRFGSLARGLG